MSLKEMQRAILNTWEPWGKSNKLQELVIPLTIHDCNSGEEEIIFSMVLLWYL